MGMELSISGDDMGKKPAALPVIVVICGDPGGANAVIPVLLQIQDEERAKLQVFAYRQAVSILTKTGISHSVVDEGIMDDSIRDLLREIQPALVLTGTSVNAVDLEKKFIRAAREMNFPTLAILDFWSNYTTRFSDEYGNMRYVPDKIAVMDTSAFSEMVDEGFSSDTLLVTGQPAFDTLARCRMQFSHTRSAVIRASFHMPAEEMLVVFVSQPLSVFYGSDASNPLFLGYTEWSVANDLVQSLERISRECNQKLCLVIRPHPRENIGDYLQIKSDRIRTIVSGSDDPRELVMASDLVAGMTTELLIEACYLGCIVVSLQPGLRSRDLLPTNGMGYSIPVYSSEKMCGTLRRMLLGKRERADIKKKLENFKPDGQATSNVIKVIFQMINQGNINGECHGKTCN